MERRLFSWWWDLGKVGADLKVIWEMSVKMYKKNILLWGGRSKSRVAYHMIRENDEIESIKIFDPTLERIPFDFTGQHIKDVIDLKSVIKNMTHFVVCIGGEHGFARFKTAKTLESLGLKTLDLIHESSYIDKTSEIGLGCHVMASATINQFCKVGDYTIVNTSATIDHECRVGDGVHIMGCAAIAGRIQIDDFATVGTNATILPDIKIGRGAVVGAAALVTKDIEDFSVVVGVPARKIRENKFEFEQRFLNELIN